MTSFFSHGDWKKGKKKNMNKLFFLLYESLELRMDVIS